MIADFIIDNWYLFLAASLVLGLLLADPLIKQMGGAKPVSVLEMPQLTREPSVIVDVSEPAEFKKSHIADAINIPAKKIATDRKKIEKYKKRNLVVVCRMGNKSQAAAKQLLKEGFEKVYTLSGGMAAWEKENLPVKRG